MSRKLHLWGKERQSQAPGPAWVRQASARLVGSRTGRFGAARSSPVGAHSRAAVADSLDTEAVDMAPGPSRAASFFRTSPLPSASGLAEMRWVVWGLFKELRFVLC